MKKYYIWNPMPKCWQVIPRSTWDEIVAKYHTTKAATWDSQERSDECNTAVIATFATRKEARQYIESIGGTWKKN